jgi:hypothetical protein
MDIQINDLLGPLLALKLFGLGGLALAAYYFVSWRIDRSSPKKENATDA